MNRILLSILVFIIVLSCGQEKEQRVMAKVSRYKHYLLHDTLASQPSFDMDYSYSNLNDSVIVIKLYSQGDLNFKSFDFTKAKDPKLLPDTLDYKKWFLCFKNSTRESTRPYIYDPTIVDDDYFILDSKREVYLEKETFTIFSLVIDQDAIGGESRLFFNKEVGFLAEYSHSNFDVRICMETDDIKGKVLRKQLISALIADSSFFPFPKELYAVPPDRVKPH